MDIHSKPIETISYEDIDAFLQDRHPESTILDYKQDWRHLERLLTAFANTSGGIVLVGVEEENNTGRPIVPATGIDLNEGEDAIKRRIGSQAYDGIYPPIFPEVAVCPQPDDPGKGVVLIRVHESRETPHATDNRQRVYVRVASQNRFAERLANLEELEWLWSRRKAAEHLRESMLAEARGRLESMQLLAGHGSTEEDPAIIECYVVPLYPDIPLLGLAALLQFAKETVGEGRTLGSYSDFPAVATQATRPIADGVAMFPNYATEKEHYVQINRWGMVHSRLDIQGEPSQPERPSFYPGWFLAHIDAFLDYLQRLYNTFASLQAKPVLVSASVGDIALNNLVWPRRAFPDIVRPFLDRKIHLLNQELLPHALPRVRDNLLGQSAQRLLWAGGLEFAGNREEIQKLLNTAMGKTTKT